MFEKDQLVLPVIRASRRKNVYQYVAVGNGKKIKRNLLFQTIVKPCLNLSHELVRWSFFNQG